MTQILALEWDGREVRVAAASRHGKLSRVEQVFAIPIPDASGTERLDPDALGKLIAAELSARHVARADCVVGLGRGLAELRILSLPPMPDDELPETVHIQAIRHFSANGDGSALDFFPLDKDPQQPRRVLAAAMGGDKLQSCRQVLESARLKPKRIVLRACAAAELYRRYKANSVRFARPLLVHPYGMEAEFSVLIDGRLAYLRAVRMPPQTDPAEYCRAMCDEIRRTVAAVVNQSHGGPPDAVVLFGTDSEHRALSRVLKEQLSLPIATFDPFDTVAIAPGLIGDLPDARGRFSSLLGLLEQASSREPLTPRLDFLNPRKAARKSARPRMMILSAAAAASLTLALTVMVWMALRNMDHKIEQLDLELADLRRTVDGLETFELQAAEIDDWVAADPGWLDELYRLADRLPDAPSVRLTRLDIRSDEAAVGRMDVQGFVDQPETITGIETALRDSEHQVFGSSGRQDPANAPYPWAFDAQVEIRRPPADPLDAQSEAETVIADERKAADAEAQKST